MGVLGYFSEFKAHLFNSHRSTNGHNIEDETLNTLDDPDYGGSFDLEQAWLLSPRLRGKTLGEIRDLFQSDLDNLLRDTRSNLATCHSKRMSPVSIWETALCNAVSVIQDKSATWIERAKTDGNPSSLHNLADEIHDQIFLIDRLLAKGYGIIHASSRRSKDQDIYGAIDGIRKFVDWDQCPALKQWMEQAKERLEQAKEGLAHGPQLPF